MFFRTFITAPNIILFRRDGFSILHHFELALGDVIAFIISFDEYAIASFLVPPGERTFPLFLYSGAKTPDLRPQMVAIAAVVIVLSLLAVLAMEFGRRWAERRLAGAE